MYTVYICVCTNYIAVYESLHYIPFHSMTYIHKHTNATVYVYMILWFWILKIWYNGMVFSLLLFFLFVSWYQIKVIYLAILWYMLNNVDSVACTYIQYIYIHMELFIPYIPSIHVWIITLRRLHGADRGDGAEGLEEATQGVVIRLLILGTGWNGGWKPFWRTGKMEVLNRKIRIYSCFMVAKLVYKCL